MTTVPNTCRECGVTEVICEVPIPAHLSHTGARRVVDKPIDACIADVVAALVAAGVETAGSCCGHGHAEPTIRLADGTEMRKISLGHWVRALATGKGAG